MTVPTGILLMLLAMAASLITYVLLGAPRDPDASRKGTLFVLGLGNFLLHWLLWLLGPIERASEKLGLTPDFFNFSGFILGAAGGVLIASGRLELGGWAIAAGGISDIMDGRIARARGVTSKYGAFVDSTLDRFVEIFALLGLVFYIRHTSLGHVIGAAAIAGSLLVSYTRARGESLGVLCKGGLMRRGERMALIFLICMLDGPITRSLLQPPGSLAFWGLGLLASGSVFTACHRAIWISRRLKEAAVEQRSGST